MELNSKKYAESDDDFDDARRALWKKRKMVCFSGIYFHESTMCRYGAGQSIFSLMPSSNMS